MALALREAFFPLKCQACGFFLEPTTSKPEPEPKSGLQSESGKKGHWGRYIEEVLCVKCSSDLISPASPMCSICGRSFKSGISDRRCGNCISDPPSYDSVRSAFFYEGSARKIVHSMKYRSVTRLALFMGASLLDQLTVNNSSCGLIILPVPLHAKKLRQRGYNQASLIAEALAEFMSRALNVSIDNSFEFHADILHRVLNTRTQAGLHKNERIANVRNAFSVKAPEKISGRHVILVDDVFTTGATVSACAKALKKAGASEVSVYTFARVKDS